MKQTRLAAPQNRVPTAILGVAIAMALSACGGGGNVRGNPSPGPSTPPPTPPGGLDFTPNVANDPSLAVAPPAVPALAPPVVFADPSINKHLSLTNSQGALGAGLRGQGVTIGFVDSGVNRNHPALAGRVGASFIHVDPKTNNTSVDDVVGHGTTVASLAAGRPVTGTYSGGQLGYWGGGIAQDAGVVSSRIIGDKRPTDDGSGAGNEIGAGQGYGDYFKGINAELANAGARIINNSWGGLYWRDPALTGELATAWKDFVVNRGGIVVFANGNSGDDPRYVGEPSDNARLPTLAADAQLERGWLTVGALDPDNPTSITSYSQQCGSAMNYCLVAPGNDVFIDPQAKMGDASYKLYQGGGTSYAAPLVAGAAAVVWSAFPYMDNHQVRQLLLAGAKDLGAPGVDPVFGWGLLDVTKAAMGPSQFAWGDFSVSFSGNSVWRNEITGSGGLVKAGGGILTLTEAGRYTGATQVNGGGLDLRKGLRAGLAIASGGTVWASGTLGGNVDNAGRLLVGAQSPARIAGNFQQAASGNLGTWLGSPLQVAGTASIAGTMSILGVKSGYTTSSKETLLTAVGGVTGTFASLKAAPNVFLDASLAYDPKNVFLAINRIDVSKAVAGMGLTGISLASAERMETAMRAIDRQLTGVAPGGIGGAFVDAAGAFQQSGSAAQADLSLRSLSGELHGASAAMTFDAIDAGRRALGARIDGLAGGGRGGGWFRDLRASGTLAQSGFDSVAVDAGGSMIGNDWRVGGNSLLGVSMARVEQAGWLGRLGDHSRGVQREVQLYGATWNGPWQASAQLATGSFQRQLQRHLLLGESADVVATPLAGNYLGASAEVARRFVLGDVALVPYAGAQYVRLADDGFSEAGGAGFGLRANAWAASRWQALAGLRAGRQWRVAGVDMTADARAEWQRGWADGRFGFDASYTGVEQWAPMQAWGLAARGSLVGGGVSATFGNGALLRLDLTQRRSPLGANGMASVWMGWRF